MPVRYRKPPTICCRQEAHEKNRIWNLLAENKLSETIASWTLSLHVAKEFKSGVPPEPLSGVIFVIAPEPPQVIINLAGLYADPIFQAAIETHQGSIEGFHSGIGKHRGEQQEIVLELGSLDRTTIYSYGGFAGTLKQLIDAFELEHGVPPPPELRARVGRPYWLSEAGTKAALEKTLGKAAAKAWWPKQTS